LQLTYEHDLAALIAQTEQELALETLHLEQTRADVELEIRTQAQANGEKLTETAIAARITAHEVVKSQAQRVLLAKHHVRLAKIADETVSQTLSRQQQEVLDLQRDLALIQAEVEGLRAQITLTAAMGRACDEARSERI
jgi:hypothetical protein